ncbi:protein NO VEIN domain-containing protein [Azorhizobium caulinodans]|uniref:protein NO VEIN domain-containing protein n=1 Tax=Azorhizobium caulinodans TaxID=7 RepID=UPI002FBD6CEE
MEAVRHATKYYESRSGGSQKVSSVEKDNVGWDLNVVAPTGAVLKVEVKGLSGRDVVVELTPNEYEKMKDPAHRADYVIYIVTEAGTSGARSHIFRYNAEISKAKELIWVACDGRQLKIQDRVAARLSAPYDPIE